MVAGAKVPASKNCQYRRTDNPVESKSRLAEQYHAMNSSMASEPCGRLGTEVRLSRSGYCTVVISVSTADVAAQLLQKLSRDSASQEKHFEL